LEKQIMAQIAPEKPRSAESEHPIHPLIAGRRSPRAFGGQPVAPATLRSLLEAARWAPSAANMQPWHFIVGTAEEPEAHSRLVSVLFDLNVRWAARAPVLMLVVVKQYADREGNLTNRSLYDAGLAVGALTFEAAARGLVLHQMGGFDAGKARELFAIPEGHEPAVAIALGYPGDPATLPDDLRDREQAPRTRKPLADFVFANTWGESSTLVS
jgi:nitroreductase